MKKVLFLSGLLMLIFTQNGQAQDKLKNMPGYDQYSKMAPQLRGSVDYGTISAKWAEDGSSFQYVKDGKLWKYDVKKKTTEDLGTPPRPERRSWNRPARGRQYASAEAPNGQLKAFHKDRNMYISNADGSNVQAITTDGNMENKMKYGIATWVYGEELGQNTAMWWSPDSKKVAFYRFNEQGAKQYYVLLDQLKMYDSLEVMSYPKVGEPNLPVDLMVYDLETKKTTLLDTRGGKSFEDGPLGTYLYGVEWTPDGSELLFHSTNRKQDIMELRAADPVTGKSRTVVREEWLPSFTKNTPEMRWLEDGKRFIWASERTGFNNYYLYNVDGTLEATITNHPFEVANIVMVDEKKEQLYYMARSGENHMKMQLHRVGLDGKKDTRMTDPAYNHSVSLSPDGKYFIDIQQTHNIAPFTNLVDSKGKVIAELAKSDMTKFNELGFKTVEAFTFTAADGKTELHGLLHFPSNFDPNKKYPLILANYGGPATNEFRETFTMPSSLTEYGFLVVDVDGRNVRGRGKRMLDEIYGKLGQVEMDDFAEGIKSLYDRPYFDKNRVGVYGTSYGGTTSATCLLRHPDVFHAAVVNSAVTDWRYYDNIYTERYMNLLENNLEGYEKFSLMNQADQLEGEIMIFFGTSDNNVHPQNSLAFINALQKAGKSFEMQIGPDQGHTALDSRRMMEFFIEHLVMKNGMALDLKR
ncbi:DPP IV N-terminal domain-containing protein [Roseivirga sp.]|jgi:dipeptidyl-peptidase-4|uniref:S9 family peptidase n=1 Tax=Roseivirga sp. TaxID=1964215 RepID=UPI000D7A9B3F|nr:DPP IV N-terminal domain-containing protein [Roseivirga sp.]MBO6496481.1 DPP IV N-terminal domain-containing protein [Roseivirga sp.]PWL28701.1 MAG: peptidase [Roseivirga sp. XM-24bin3]